METILYSMEASFFLVDHNNVPMLLEKNIMLRKGTYIFLSAWKHNFFFKCTPLAYITCIHKHNNNIEVVHIQATEQGRIQTVVPLQMAITATTKHTPPSPSPEKKSTSSWPTHWG
jgi:hypothetical protein